jgi:hypothetical protein
MEKQVFCVYSCKYKKNKQWEDRKLQEKVHP